MDIEEIKELVLRHVNQKNYQPVKAKVIAKKIGTVPDDMKLLKRAIKRLIRSGQLAYGSGHLITKATDSEAGSKPKDSKKKKKSDEVTGRFQRAAKGFGFIRTLGTPKSAERTMDVFVPQNRSQDAATGDVVTIKLYKGRGLGGREERVCGEITEIVERQSHKFVGTYYESHGYAMVQVDGNVFTKPISVGDSGAKNAQPKDKIVVEMVRFPSHIHEGEAVIVEVLGKRGEPGVDLLSIIHEFNLPGEFPEDALEVTRQQAEAFDESIGEDRFDLTDTTVLTIDPATARDFDDAISLERLKNGHWKLGVHIADVAHFVPEGSALDIEARNRATSVYLPGKVIPMLPETISNNLASLQPKKLRYAKTAFIEYSPDGSRVHTQVVKSAIKSDHRFTYEDVDDFLEDRGPWEDKLGADVFRLLGEMHELAMVLRKRRFKRGSIELTMPEVRLDLNKDGQVIGAHTEKNTESHQIIEEFMLAANEAVAEKLHDDGLFFLRRAHASPDPRKLQGLTEFVKDIGIECEDLVSRFEIIRVLEEVKGKPEQAAVNFATLRSMQKAVYSPEEEGHFALASDCYCHFTSPIRRYPDLTIHRMYNQLAEGKKPVQDFGLAVAEGEHCSEREQRAAKAERELTKIKLLNYFSERIGDEMKAVITGVEGFGLFVQGLDIPADGLIHIDSLQDDYYRYDAATHTMTGHKSNNRFRLGDVIKVAIAHVDIDKRELDFRFVDRYLNPGEEPPRRERRVHVGSGKTAPRKAGPRKVGVGGKPAKGSKKDSSSRKKKTSSKHIGTDIKGKSKNASVETTKPDLETPAPVKRKRRKPKNAKPEGFVNPKGRGSKKK
ncbi:MAG: ribonuclease R [Pirellulales bacterium]